MDDYQPSPKIRKEKVQTRQRLLRMYEKFLETGNPLILKQYPDGKIEETIVKLKKEIVRWELQRLASE